MKRISLILVRAFLLVIGSGIIGAALATNPATASSVKLLLQPFALHTCSSSNPCVAYKNNGAGAAIVGTGTNGDGIVASSTQGVGLTTSSQFGLGTESTSSLSDGIRGATGYPSGGKRVGHIGVYGVDESTDLGNLNIGVKGFSATGIPVAGVFGVDQPFGHVPTAVLGISLADSEPDDVVGVVGLSGGSPGVLGEADTSNGVAALSNKSTALVAESDSADPRNAAIVAIAPSSMGIIADNEAGNQSTSLEVLAGTTDAATNSIVALDGNSVPEFWVDNGGNAHVRGNIYTSGFCNAGCARTKDGPGKVVERYVPQESIPTMEDLGEGRLTDGATFVRIDPAFANVIDGKANYLVFVTPQGPTQGLYVTNKTMAGFEVVEHGGHSSIAFDYRIVAKPYGVDAQRLPALPSSTLPKAIIPAQHPTRLPQIKRNWSN